MSPSRPVPAAPASDLTWLSGGGEMGALIRSMDWSTTPLGPLETWPQSLRTTVSLCLSSTFPILVCWGEQDIQIYNDAYRPICGDLHPASMGGAFKEVWASALPVVGAAFDRAHQGEGVYIKDQQMFLDRYGYLEEAFMTFSFSPIRDESGEVGGVFHPITEGTGLVLSARRTQCLRDLSASLADARTLDEIGRDLEAHGEQLALDVPYMLFYQAGEDGQVLLRGRTGVDADSELAPATALLGEAPWPFAAASASGQAQTVHGLAPRIGGARCGPYEQLPDTAMVLPILLPGQPDAFGYLVAGVSACRALDPAYLDFYDRLGAAVATAAGNVIAYEQEQRRAEELARIDRAKTAFFSNVSHEFRTPLTLILGPLDDALLDADEPLGPRQRRRLDLTHRNALRLLKLVNSLLDFSRIEAGRVQASFAPADLGRLTLDLASVFESTMAKGGLAYAVEAEDLGEPVWVDRDMWEKVVFNLLSNAFKFTLEGGVTVRLARVDDMAQLTVCDTGSGIPESELPRVFERFHRVEGAAGRSYEGTGIGLALIQELVRLHGGAITVHSTVGEGTRFEVRLPFGHEHLPAERVAAAQLTSEAPAARTGAAFVEEALRWLPDADQTLAPVPSQSPAPAAPAAPIADRRGPRPRILVADDNNDMRGYLKSLLEPHADVAVCADGEQAFHLVEQDPPDLLITDVMMPVLDGFGLLARIRADAALRRVPVMLLSARAGEEAKVEGLQAGADDYMVKPFAASELLARVRGQLAQAEERRRQAQATASREQYFRDLVDAAPVILWTTDADEQCTYLSQRWYDFTGRTPEQDLGRGWLDNVHPDDLERTVATYLDAAAARAPVSLDFRLRRSDGSYRWVIDNGLPRVDEAGQHAGYVGTVIDVHERRLLQERFEQVARAGDIGAWFADAPFNRFQLNSEMARHLGLGDCGHAHVRELLDTIDPGDRARVEFSMRRALDEGSLDVEFRTGPAHGARWLRALGWYGRGDGQQVLRFDGVTLDVGSHKAAEQDLRRLADELSEKNRQQSEFLSTLAHELRNPLAPIRAGIELMQAGGSPARQREVQGMMRRQVEHMVHLVDDLLDMARLAEGKVTLRLDDVLLQQVVDEAVAMCTPLISARSHRLALRLPPAPLTLNGDRHRLAQVISNLVNNAAKYTPDGGDITVAAQLDGVELRIDVIDTGIGIAPAVLPTVFDMYAQGSASEAMGDGGLGVGLNLVQRLVQLHGGRVAAASDGEGQGSRFSVWLPVPPVQPGQAPVPASGQTAATELQPTAPAPGLRVLVVDDNLDAADMLASLLEIGGHQARVAHDAAGALAAARMEPPQVVFLDIGLPDMSGHEAARLLRQVDGMGEAMLVALTGWGTDDDRRKSREAGFDHHLTKPAEFDAVDRLLAEAQSARGGAQSDK